MAITVDWPNKVINVPKADMSLIQATPTEIRELDLNWFRLQLKDLEDDAEGMPFVDTHSHTPPLDVGGVTLARAVEIINDYTVTFEDGQYAVNLVGANSNVGDRVNVNQVSVRSANSAGLVTSAAIEFGEYGGAVTVNVDTGEAGSIYPIGTLRRPVGNFQDAMIIANARGFSQINLISDATLTNGDVVADMTLVGINSVQTTTIIETGADVTNCEFREMSISGVLDGGNLIGDCTLGVLNYVNGEIHHCKINDTITLGGGAEAHIHGSYSGIPGLSSPEIDMGGTGQSLGLRAYSGGITITNLTGTDNVSLDFLSGQAVIDSTVSNGTIVIRGTVKVIDNSTGTALIEMDSVSLPATAYNGEVYIDTVGGDSGEYFPSGTNTQPVLTAADVEALSTRYNLKGVALRGTLVADRDFIGHNFRSLGSVSTTIIVLAGRDFTGSTFYGITLTSSIVGAAVQYEDCILSNVSGLSGVLADCGINGTATIGGDLIGRNVSFIDSPSIIELASAPADVEVKLVVRSGDCRIDNMSGGQYAQFTQDAGEIEIGSTCTGGIVLIRGSADIVDNSSGAVTVIDNTIIRHIVDDTWDELMASHTTAGTSGELLWNILKMTNHKVVRVGNTANVYEENGVDIWKSFDLSNGGRVEI